MVAFVVKNKKRGQRHRIKTVLCEKLCVVLAGDKVPFRRLKRKLAKFSNDVMFSDDFNIAPLNFPYKNFNDEVLFNCFAEFINKESGKHSVGILDFDGRFLERLVEVFPKAKSVSICCGVCEEQFMQRWVIDYGVAPEVSASADVLDGVDVIFAPDGFGGHCKFLFGKGGYLLSANRFPLPDYCSLAVSLGADRLRLAALLSAEEPLLSTKGLVPPFLQKGQEIYRLI